jgi:hypothetical protein
MVIIEATIGVDKLVPEELRRAISASYPVAERLGAALTCLLCTQECSVPKLRHVGTIRRNVWDPTTAYGMNTSIGPYRLLAFIFIRAVSRVML